jgi:uncharacterized protein YjbJ (UPF0337 family)
MNKDQANGRIDEVKGKIKEVAGKLTGDKTLEVKGKVQGGIGSVVAAKGDLKENLKDTVNENVKKDQK